MGEATKLEGHHNHLHRPHLSDLHMHRAKATMTHKVKNQSNYYHSARNLVRVSGSVIPRISIPTLLATAWATGWTVFHILYPHKWFKDLIPKSNLLITIVGVVMGLLLVFRNNTAYDRYWEGRRLFSTLETNVRNMTRFVWIGVPARDAHEALEKRGAMNLLIAFMHATKHYLRSELGVHYDDVQPYISHLPEYAPDAPAPPDMKNLPVEISLHLGGFINKIRQREQIDVSLYGCMNNALNAMMDCLSGFERIRGTPLPFAYGVHLKQTLVLYLLSLPFQLLDACKWSTIPMCALAAFTLLGLEAIGGEIENPFGFDANDLPIDDISFMIHEEILGIMDRPDKLDTAKWSLPWEDLTSTKAELNPEALAALRKAGH
ncbi:Bestrophin/UPF0187 [Fimicolochytrium jonesii]|uniref:Bestrophin/UPF0187 n=1 Tax=Fimicolochytrium jonesii TaxID=1396493 RepID=UPI0022FE50B8|nr:Bestrophin/UPF0187 [Fimicolochytrium jonesii]KAI8817991.1 Bestrophin/UPF0187 [Fimicolochytrium jonesii]